jgi:hypothetical protein
MRQRRRNRRSVFLSGIKGEIKIHDNVTF